MHDHSASSARPTRYFWPRAWLRLLIARIFFRRIPHGRMLGLRVLAADAEALIAELPYRETAVGNPWTGYLHSGAITTLIDQACGTVASLAAAPPALVATLDLRLDWVRPAAPGLPVRARAECRRVTRQIIFVHCTAYHESPDDPIAVATATFMRSGPLIPNPFRRRAARQAYGRAERG